MPVTAPVRCRARRRPARLRRPERLLGRRAVPSGGRRQRHRRRLPVQDHQHRHRRARCCASSATSRSELERARPRPTRSSGRTTTPAPRSPPRCWPGKIDIGSMGDYPLLINGSARRHRRRRHSMVAVTGYNLHGALNGVVVAPDSDVETARATSRAAASPPASARPGTAPSSRRSRRPGIDPDDDVSVENQDPPRRRLRAPGRLGRRGRRSSWPGRGCSPSATTPGWSTTAASWSCPTLHGTVVRNEFAAEHGRGRRRLPHRPRSTPPSYLHENPLEAAEIVAEETGLPGRGRLPLQRPQRRLHLRHHDQARAGRGPRARRPVPEVDRRARPTRSTSTRSSTTR